MKSQHKLLMYQRVNNKRSLNFIRRTFLFMFFFLGIFTLFTIEKEVVQAETCSYRNHAGCSGGPTGCTYSYSYGDVQCTLQGADSCPDPLFGNRCDRGGYTNRYIACSPNADESYYSCGSPSNTWIPSGFCGCSGSPPDPDEEPPLPSECSSCSCNFGCGGSGTCVPNAGECGYDDQDPPSANKACRSCPDKCCKPKCSCTPSCTSPSGLNVNNLTNAPRNKNIEWSLDYWGLDEGKSTCSNDKCSRNAFSNEGKFRLYSGSTNITNICNNYQTDSKGYYLIQGTTKCEITNIDAINPSWPGTTQTFKLVAENNCGSTEKNLNVTWAPDEKPFCDGFTYSSIGLDDQNRDGLIAINPYEDFNFSVNVGETDPYGPPTSVNVCYAIRNQSVDFYKIGGTGNSWVCFDAQYNTNRYQESKTYQELKDGYANVTSTYSGSIDDHGFVFSVNVRNNMSGNFCSTNIGFNNGTGAYWPDMSTKTCDGGSCTIEIHDRAPEIVSVGMQNTNWIGRNNSPAINTTQYSCTNNNPVIYNMEVTDPDKSADVDLVELSIAKPNDVRDDDNNNILDNNLAARYWPLRIRFAKEWRANGGQRFANGNFMVRDMAVKTNTQTSRRCINQSRAPIDYEPSGFDANDPDCRFSNNTSCRSYNARFSQDTVFCYAYDSHSWTGASYAQNQSLTIGGTNYTVNAYYLSDSQDITVYNEGYNARILGESNWKNGTYVAYEVGGNRVWAQYRVEYLDDGNQTWNGQYKNVWYARDLYEKEDDNENLSGEYIVDNNWTNTFHVKGDTKIDLTPPNFNSVPEPTKVINASTIGYTWSAGDNLSGLSHVWGEARHSLPSSSASICRRTSGTAPCSLTPGYPLNLTSVPPTTPSSSALWRMSLSNPATASRLENINVGENEEGSINFYTFAVDNACNLSDQGEGMQLTEPWLITRGGLVYSGGRPDIGIRALDPANGIINNSLSTTPYDILKGEINLSTELLSSGNTIDSTQYISNSTNPYRLQNYPDQTKLKPWFEDIFKSTQNQIATRKTEFATSLSATLASLGGNVSSLSSNACADSTKNCVIRTNVSSRISSDLICDRKTVIFIDGDLVVDADVTPSGVTNGCIFVVSGNVTIEDMDATNSRKSPNNATYPSYDLLESFIISMGYIYLPEVDTGASVNMRDGIKINGALVAFGNGPNNRSIIFERSLKLRNNLEFPTEVLVHDPRYFQIAEELMGNTDDTYKQDIGFKP
jgi:hypothetical protein